MSCVNLNFVNLVTFLKCSLPQGTLLERNHGQDAARVFKVRDRNELRSVRGSDRGPGKLRRNESGNRANHRAGEEQGFGGARGAGKSRGRRKAEAPDGRSGRGNGTVLHERCENDAQKVRPEGQARPEHFAFER